MPVHNLMYAYGCSSSSVGDYQNIRYCRSGFSFVTPKAGKMNSKQQSARCQPETIGLPQKHGRSIFLHKFWEQPVIADVLSSRDIRLQDLRVWE